MRAGETGCTSKLSVHAVPQTTGGQHSALVVRSRSTYGALARTPLVHGRPRDYGTGRCQPAFGSCLAPQAFLARISVVPSLLWASVQASTSSLEEVHYAETCNAVHRPMG